MEIPIIENQKSAKKEYKKFVLGFLIIFILSIGGFFMWENYLSPDARHVKQIEKQSQALLQWEKNLKEIQKNDVYGGKTPEETLKMFIDALKKEDIELASKYFEIDMNEQPYNRENYLTRKKWEDGLKKAKAEGKLPKIISVLLKAKPAGSSMNGYFGFETRDDKNELTADISMKFNQYSNIWKIESL